MPASIILTLQLKFKTVEREAQTARIVFKKFKL